MLTNSEKQRMKTNTNEQNTNHRRDLGIKGEQLAAEYLRNRGYEIIALNYRCRYGEIDIIAKDGSVWCFVEVKTRSNERYGPGYEAVTRRKRQKMFVAAQWYMTDLKLPDAPARFDVVTIYYRTSVNYRVELFQNAFSLRSM